MTLDHVALIMLIIVVIVLFYGVIVIHDIPYEISKKRNHPHQDAIHVAGWVSLFTLHILWPFLWIWATLWRDNHGWGFKEIEADQKDIHRQVDLLTEQVKHLQDQLAHVISSTSQPSEKNNSNTNVKKSVTEDDIDQPIETTNTEMSATDSQEHMSQMNHSQKNKEESN